MQTKKLLIEYIWLDGNKTPELRSKTRVLEVHNETTLDLGKIPEWAFDGSSTNQAEGHFSDCLLKPVAIYPDPIRGESHKLVLCEVYNPDESLHPSNTRKKLVKADQKYKNWQPWFGIEQEYTLFKLDKPLAWAELGKTPDPQGKYYCGVGAGKAFGRPLVEAHLKACLDAGLAIWGINAEVMPGQWEFQIGPESPVEVSDQLWIARWLLQRLGESYGTEVSFDPKPMTEGDWNGAGAHTNFSTIKMREKGGMFFIEKACQALKAYHREHIAVYGEGNERRLTGKHETCDINTFRYGQSDRGASVRIPVATTKEEKGYLEDRRPAANMDPYLVCRAMLETICGGGFKN